MKRSVISAFFLLLAGMVAAAPDKPVFNAPLKEATVYRLGAELFHTARVNFVQGNNDIVIDGISNRVDISSIQIGTEGKFTIMSMEFSTDYLRPVIKSPIVIRLQDSLESVKRDLVNVQVLITTNKEMLDLLKANRNIGGTQNGVSVAELVKMMEYYKAKSLELEKELTVFREKETKLQDQANRLASQIAEEDQKNAKTAGKLLLQVMAPVAGTYNLNISYLTPAAFWNAAYDLKVENINKPINVSYKAKLVQTTGIDWKNVKLTLATSTPSQQGVAPVFQTWFLDYMNPVVRMESTLMNTVPSIAKGRIVGDDASKEVGIRGYGSIKNGTDPLYVVNGEVMSAEDFSKINKSNIKEIKVLKDASATAIYGARAANGVVIVTLKDSLGDYVSVSDNELNVTYAIDIPYDVPSNGKEQQVALKDLTIPSFYKYYSAPKLDQESYLLAEVSDWESLNLLPGEANIMFEGTYVGKTFIDPQSTLDTLNLTLGHDKRVVVKREKLKDFSSVKFLGTNKKQVLTYELTVKNNKKEKVEMILKDQFPVSNNKDIEVELLESSGGSVNNEVGVVSWKLELNPGEVKKYRISYSVKYPKDKLLNL